MKKYCVYFLTLLLSMALVQCKKFSLELAPEDYFASGNFWKTRDQVNGAMLGLHSGLRDNMWNFFTMGEMRGGTLRGGGTDFTGLSSLNSADIITQNLRESNPGIGGWGGLYPAVFQVNNFIYNVEPATYLGEKEKEYFLAQAYGIRAFYYFYLYRTFGRVPIVKEPKVAIRTPRSAQDVFLPRSKTEQEVLDFIKADIALSIEKFAGNKLIKDQKGQWSLAATLMLKTEVYLWSAKVPADGKTNSKTEDLQTALMAVDSVINYGGFSLLPDFAQVFQSASRPASKGNSEIIFAFRYLNGEATNNFGQFLYSQNAEITKFMDTSGKNFLADPLRVAGSGTVLRYEYKKEFVDTFCKGDKRGPATFLTFKIGGTTAGSVLRKFLGTIINGVRNYSDDWPVYRLAEAYLLRAEIKNAMKNGNTNGCKQDIMMVRNRAWGKSGNGGGNGVPECKGNGNDEIELEIFWERSKELVAEGKRWFDLRRMQKSNQPLAVYMTVKDGLLGVLQNSEMYKLLWPISLGTLQSDPTLQGDQNPGYTGT